MADKKDQATEQAANQENAPAVKFLIQRIYVKDSSFEAPGAPGIFRAPYKPSVSFNMNTKTSNFDASFYEVILTLTAEVKNAEDNVLYIAEVQQAGIFDIEGIEKDDLARVLHTTCPNILYPYARESIDNLASKGSFPTLMLAPVNFDSAYEQALQQKATQEAEKKS
tara:strand:+ start:1502 stop:2002 length:501 start_codon:yes stop_codon:yes gene_type:complete